MAEKIKHTKTELKAQRDSLTRFERFLPMLQLKKQQLQIEIQTIRNRVDAKEAEAQKLRTDLEKWIRLFSEPHSLDELLTLSEVRTSEGNIAGVAIPVLEEAIITRAELDLWATPTWYDDALDMIEKLIRLRVEREILDEQLRLIQQELTVTSQRVNLFEKVKIPECREHIRVIKIFLGDEQTAAVARGKIAKKRAESFQYEDEAA